MNDRWDYLIIAAGSPRQAQLYEIHLERIQTFVIPFAKQFYVQADRYPGLGPGLATADIITKLEAENPDTIDTLKVLIIHSGGFSKRLPHVAPFGKIFTYLLDGTCLLIKKLTTYRHIPKYCQPGIFVSACDTIETIDQIKPEAFQESFFDHMLIFGHYSSLETATQHGVFVIDKEVEGRQTLKKVLQKPTVEEMKKENAIWNDAMALTDSCYMMNMKLARDFAKFCRETEREIGYTEICCYGDFMRPIGTEATEEYIESANSISLKQWRKRLYDFFHAITGKEAVVIGVESKFYHFGLINDILEHQSPSGNFYKKEYLRYIYTYIKSGVKVIIPDTSIIEFSDIRSNIVVPEKCLISSIEIPEEAGIITFKSNTTVITWFIRGGKYVTIMVDNNCDFKTEKEDNQWFDNKIPGKQSIYSAKLFPVCDTAFESLLQTMILANGAVGTEGLKVSIEEAIQYADGLQMLNKRGLLIANWGYH